ncbi:zinc ribbon domain-containing protein [Rhodopirellula bahusiensis]|uniref:Uncharacterized protein n=1 Tax=Rhodopirellula bahusiensis TaxID=2014065 RepID=A0A2G1VZT5_9BACT|nr:hypothetical protein [Rhodopirellula bahusiensis]PHQ32292.1 hypothetical protein CEE69_26450 [Rhodopirellula bahusiensis]
MSHRSVRCPQCKTTANLPASVVTARCPSCGQVFSVESAQIAAAPQSAAAKPTKKTSSSSSGDINVPLIAGVMGGVVFIALIGILAMTFMPESNPSATSNGDSASSGEAPAESDQPVLVVLSEEELAALPIANVPEDKRKSIYDQIRDSARTTIEAPLLVPDGNAVRSTMEKSQQAIHDNSMRQLAALHDISLDDIALITAEGDAKNWDPSPRSHARRNGERLYPEERSRGWKGKSKGN